MTSSIPFIVSGKQVMVYGLQQGRDDPIISLLEPVLAIAPDTVDGISIEPRGVHSKCMELVVEIHGRLTASQLRLLADAIDQ